MQVSAGFLWPRFTRSSYDPAAIARMDPIFTGHPTLEARVLKRLDDLNKQFTPRGSMNGFTLTGPGIAVYNGPVKDVRGDEKTILLQDEAFFARYVKRRQGIELIQVDDKERYQLKRLSPYGKTLESSTWQLTAKLAGEAKPVVMKGTVQNSPAIRSAFDLMVRSVHGGIQSVFGGPGYA